MRTQSPRRSPGSGLVAIAALTIAALAPAPDAAARDEVRAGAGFAAGPEDAHRKDARAASGPCRVRVLLVRRRDGG